MDYIPKLIEAYEQCGAKVVWGLNPLNFFYIHNVAAANLVGFSGGIMPIEVVFFEKLCSKIKPSNILILGNAFGWSTLILSLINPQSKVVSIDPNSQGNELTNQIATKLGLNNCCAVDGFSPQDVESIYTRFFSDDKEKPFLFFIDALHSNYHQSLDFNACYKIVAPEKPHYFLKAED